MPIAVGNGSRVAQVSGNRRTKLEEPAPYALVGNIQTPLRKEILHIPIAQSEPGIEPNGASNDFRWKAVTFEGDGVHPKRLHRNHQIEIRALNVTMPFFNAGQRYFLLIKAPGHREIFQVLNRRSFITREDGAEVERPDTTIRTIMIPKKAKSLDLDAGFNKLKSRESPLGKEDIGISRETYNNLKPAAKMAMLNIEAKLRSTEVDGTTLSKLVTGLRHVEPDRIYVMMQPQIKEMVERSPVFAPAPGPRREEKTQSAGTPRQLETSSVSGGEPATFLLRKSRELAGPLFRQRTVVFGRC